MMLERKEIKMSENVPTSGIASARKYLKRRASVMVASGGHHRFMTSLTLKRLKRALEVSNRRKARETETERTRWKMMTILKARLTKWSCEGL